MWVTPIEITLGVFVAILAGITIGQYLKIIIQFEKPHKEEIKKTQE